MEQQIPKRKLNVKAVINALIILVLLIAVIIGLVSLLKKSNKKVNNVETKETKENFFKEYEYISYLQQKDGLSLVISFTNDGKFSFGFANGGIYKDYDLYDSYKFDDEGNIVISGENVDDTKIEVKELDEKRITIVLDGKDITLFRNKAFVLVDGKMEGTFTRTDSDNIVTVSFNEADKVEIKNEYTNEDNSYSYKLRYKYVKDEVYDKECILVGNKCEFYVLDLKIAEDPVVTSSTKVYDKK